VARVLFAAAVSWTALTGPAAAIPCYHCFIPEESQLVVRLGGLPRIAITSKAEGWWTGMDVGWVNQLVPPFGNFVAATNSVWSTVNFRPGTSLFTGVPLGTLPAHCNLASAPPRTR